MLKYHDTNALAGGRSHVSMCFDYPKLGAEVAIDIQCPAGVAKDLPKPLIDFMLALGQSNVGPSPKRSSKWPALLKLTIDAHPYCAVCGNKNKKSLIAHHITPVWVDSSKELDPGNLIVLCENSDKLPGFNCHLTMGRMGNYRLWNPRIHEVVEQISKQMKGLSK